MKTKTRSQPAHIIEVHLRMISEPALVWASAVVVLYTISVEALYLTVVFCYDELHKHLTLRSQQQSLKLLWILELLQGLSLRKHLEVVLGENVPKYRVMHD